MDTRISGKTRLLGVFGTPIKHSGSPIMYNSCFDYYGIDCAYLAFDTDAIPGKRFLSCHGTTEYAWCQRYYAM